MEDNATKLLNKEVIKYIQQMVGTLLFCAFTLNCTILVALRAILTTMTKGTEATMAEVDWLLYYCAMHPDAKLC